MSNIKVITINPTLHQVFTENKGDYVSIKEIKTYFNTGLNIQITSEEFTKVIYRQLLRLLKNKIIEKNLLGSSRRLGYKATQEFEQVKFKYKKFQCESEVIKAKRKPESAYKTENVIKTLNIQLTQYEVDFQSSIAESEEYKRLFTIAPEMKEILESHFLTARNNSNQLLGKITAVKNVIEKLESSNQ